jgi:rhamnulose-1-phosphate aldolase
MNSLNASTRNKLRQLLPGIRDVAGWLWERAWAEWGAGNISINVTEFVSEITSDTITHNDISKVHKKQNHNLSLLMSLSGSRMRQIMKKPENGFCLMHFNEKSASSIIPLAKHQQLPSPTSEFKSHLLIHQTLLKHRPHHKAVLHTHPAEIIALSQIQEFRSQEATNNKLSAILPELSIYLPEGIAFVPYHESGSNELAEASAAVMKDFRVAIWEKHGIIATGSNLEEAFDAIDLVAKAARIWFMIRSAGSGKATPA